MNAAGRATLEKAVRAIEDAKETIEELALDERGKFDNMSEGLQQTESGQKLEGNADALDEAVSALDDVLSNLGDVG
jgi:hypothetical protein